MTLIKRNLRLLFLACAPIVLAGCQHPLAPTAPTLQPVKYTYAYVGSGDEATANRSSQSLAEPCALKTKLADQPDQKKEALLAGAQKDPQCLTVELGDSLLSLFKTFTGR